MDTLASLALATEVPNEDLLKRKPYGRTQPLISLSMMKNIVGQAIYQLLITFGLLFYGPNLLGFKDATEVDFDSKMPSIHITVIFNTFVMMTLFNEINARKLDGQKNVFKGIFTNPIFCGIWITTMAVQAIIVQFGGRALTTKPLPGKEWGWCLLFGFGTLVWQQFINILPIEYIIENIELPCCSRKDKSVVDFNFTESDSGNIDDEDQIEIPKEMSTHIDLKPGKVLWIRGVRRIQTQLRVIDAFKSPLEALAEQRTFVSQSGSPRQGVKHLAATNQCGKVLL